MWKIWAVIAWILTSPAMSQSNMDEVNELTTRLLPRNFEDLTENDRVTWLKEKLATSSDSAEIYVLNREMFRSLLRRDELKEAARYCSQLKFLSDDLDLRTLCVEAAEGIMPHEEAKQILTEILHDAKRLKRPDNAVDALNSIAWIQSQDGDISEALGSYAEALDLIPKENERSRFNVLFNLATNYIIHGNDDYIRKGINILQEIKNTSAERARVLNNQDDARVMMSDSYLAAFNIGIAYTLHLHDYENAIPEFEYAKLSGDRHRVEALSFAALAAATIKRNDLAKKFIAEINGEESRNPIKEGYLKCYRALAVRHWNPGNSLASCLNLHPDTTLEVVSDINHRVALLKGQPEELEGLRAHMRMYEERIKPEYKKRAAKAASNAELKRLETEAILKDEKIALGERIKLLLYVVLMISFLLLGMMLVVLRSRRIIKIQARNIENQKLRFQNVLQNIDEGIITINQDGSISPVYSRHVTEILKQDPAQMQLGDLLLQLGMEGDELAAAREVFNAMLGEESLAWEFNEGLLPQTGTIHGAPFLFYWSPIIRNGRINEVILSIRDASASMALEKEAHTRNRILAVVSGGPIGQNFIRMLDDRLNDVRSHITGTGAPHCLRLAHTIKGEARSLGFTELQDSFHHLEQALLKDDLTQARQIMTSIDEAAQGYMDVLQLLKRDHRQAQGHPVLGLLQTVLDDAQKRLQTAGFDLVSDIQLNWVPLNEDEVNALRDILVHGVANAIDHGYLLPKKRNQAVDQLARIAVKLYVKGDSIHFSIIDHGIGIDWKALEEIARKRNWTPPKDADLADIVFLDKVSTVAEIQVSKTSGRGIGMAAVAAAVKSLDGCIKFGVGFNHHGARLDIKWKRRFVIEEQETKAAS